MKCFLYILSILNLLLLDNNNNNVVNGQIYCQRIGQNCEIFTDCCSLNCNTSIGKCIKINRNNLAAACLPIGNPCKQSYDCCSKICKSTGVCGTYADLWNYSQLSVYGDNPNNIGCKAYGKKCFDHSECCSLRCHGYKHQCVS